MRDTTHDSPSIHGASGAELPPDVAIALRAAFGDRAVDDLTPLSGGMSRAPVLSFTVDGAAYVVKATDRAQCPNEATCAAIASELGVTPRVVHVDRATGVLVQERVGEPLGRRPVEPTVRIARLAATLRRLHEGATFPRGPSAPEVVRGMDAQLRARGGAGIAPSIVTAVERAATALASGASGAASACHHDLNPNNVLETDERVYFVDWAAASQGDPLVDVAQLGVFALSAPAARDALLAAYLGHAPSDAELGRAALARVTALGCYAAAFTAVAAAMGLAVEGASSMADLAGELATNRERVHPGRIASALRGDTERELALPRVVHALAARAAR